MYSEPTETIELENKTIEIYVDEFPIDPREWDNLGTMAFYHRRYNLGDKHEFMRLGTMPSQFGNLIYDHYDDSPDGLLEFLDENKVIFFSVFIYDHSGIALSIGRQYPFNCPWDSGMLGYIYVTYEQVRNEFGWKNLTQKRIQKIQDILQSELETYNYYASGRCYGYHLVCNDCKKELDTTWGFYGENWQENGIMDYAQDYTCQCQTAKVFQNAGVGL